MAEGSKSNATSDRAGIAVATGPVAARPYSALLIEQALTVNKA
jgi:hypothetical protein